MWNNFWLTSKHSSPITTCWITEFQLAGACDSPKRISYVWLFFPLTFLDISHINIQATFLHYFIALISFSCWSPPCTSEIYTVTQNTPCLRKPCRMDTRIMHRLPFRLFRPTFNRRCRGRRKVHSFTWRSYPFLGRSIWGGETQRGGRCPQYVFIAVRGWDTVDFHFLPTLR